MYAHTVDGRAEEAVTLGIGEHGSPIPAPASALNDDARCIDLGSGLQVIERD